MKQLVLIGNSFPLSLARRSVSILPAQLNELRAKLADGCCILSFWGHANTLAAASTAIGHDLTPASERPVLTLSPDGLPMLGGHVFHECWILSPDYAPGFRPAIGIEVTADQIQGWQLLHLRWA